MLGFNKKTNCLFNPLNSWRPALSGAVCLAALLLGDNIAHAGKLQTYWTTDENVAKKTPKEDGSNGWNQVNIASPIVVPGPQQNRNGDRFVWIAWRNEDRAEKHKFFRVEFLRKNNEAFTIDEVKGYPTDTDASPVNPAGLSRKRGNPEVREYSFTPQPKWERIRIDNDQPGNTNWLLQADAWSVCAEVKPKNLKTIDIKDGTFGAPGAMQGNPRTTELCFFPLYSPIDTDATPTFAADAQTGNWSFEYVYADPLGNPRPEGGLRWTTDGVGFLTGDEFDATLDVLNMTSGAMSIFAFDAESQVYLPWDMIEFGPPWIEPFDIYLPGEGVIGWRGWSGRDDDPELDAIITPQIFLSPPASLDVRENANVVKPFENVTEGQWHFSCWTYIPNGYQGGSTLALFDEYQHNGPQHPGLISQFDSNTGQIFFLCGDPNPVQVPYIVDQWVPIDVVVDLENDHCVVFYDQQPVCEYAWTAGAFGDGSGQPAIAAVNLWANGSASVFYDDMILVPITPPEETIILDGFNVVTGSYVGGDLGDLADSDDQYLIIHSGFGQEQDDLYKMEVIFSGSTTLQNTSTIDLNIESRIDRSTGSAKIRLKNWTTGQLDVVADYQISDIDSVIQVADLDASLYVSKTGEIELELKHSTTLSRITPTSPSILDFTFVSFIDEITIIARQ